MGVTKHQVNVRGQIELPGTQLAHADHHHLLLDLPAFDSGHGRAVDSTQRAVVKSQRALQTALGQRGDVTGGFLQAGQAVEVAPDNAQQLAVAKIAQGGVEGFFICIGGIVRRQQCGQLRGASRLLQAAVVDQRLQQSGLAATQIRGKAAAGPHPAQGPGEVGVRQLSIEPAAVIRLTFAKRGEVFVGLRLQRVGQWRQGVSAIGHDGCWAWTGDRRGE